MKNEGRESKISECIAFMRRYHSERLLHRSKFSMLKINRNRACEPFWKPNFMLYAGLLDRPSACQPVVSMLLPSAWCQYIICLAPEVHPDGFPSHHTGALAGATCFVLVAPVTWHLYGIMYMLPCPQPFGTLQEDAFQEIEESTMRMRSRSHHPNAQMQPCGGHTGKSGTW
jgi:hypothetical protein